MKTGLRSVLLSFGTGFVALSSLSPSAQAQVATALLRENMQLPGAAAGQLVNSLNNSAVNHVGGYAIQVNTLGPAGTLSHV
jgi:hypothetical protein